MNDSRKGIRKALLVCVPYFVIIFFLDDLDNLLYTIHSRLGNPLLVLYVFIATIIIFALLIHELTDLKQNYKVYGYIGILPFLIYAMALANSFWSPLRISSEIFHSRIVYRAYRREKYGHALIKMRENGSLSIRYPGPFGMSEWEYGKWEKDGDTFYLNYNNNADVKPDTLIKAADGLLFPIGIPDDSLKLYRDRFFRMPVSKKNK